MKVLELDVDNGKCQNLKQEATPEVWMPCGLNGLGILQDRFLLQERFVWNILSPGMLVALKSWKMPNHTNTWSCQTATIIQKISRQDLTTKETWPKDDASCLFRAVTCPPVKIYVFATSWSTEGPSQIWKRVFLPKLRVNLDVFALICAQSQKRNNQWDSIF